MKKIIMPAVLMTCILFAVSNVCARNYQHCMDEGYEAKNMCDNDKAFECFEEALKYKNEDPVAMFHIGKIYEERGDVRKASEYYEKVIAISYHPLMTYEIGAFYLKIGDLNRAEEIYSRALRHRVNLVEANLGMADYNFAIKNYDKAIEFYQFVVERDQKRAIAFYRYAMCLEAVGKDDEALEMCEKAMRIENSEDIRKYYKHLKNKKR